MLTDWISHVVDVEVHGCMWHAIRSRSCDTVDRSLLTDLRRQEAMHAGPSCDITQRNTNGRLHEWLQ
jgi:hypothetical protein